MFKTTTTKELIEDFKQKTNDILEYTSFMMMSNDRKYLKIDELVKNLKNIKKQIKINKNNELFIDYLMTKWSDNLSNLSFKQSAEISMYKEKCSTISSSTMLENICVEATSNYDPSEGWDATLETIKITAKFKDSIEVTCKINRDNVGNQPFTKPECDITLQNHSRKNPRMYEHKRKNQKKIDYCIVKGSYFAGTKEEKIYNHWTYFLNTIKYSLEKEENFVEFFNKLEKKFK